MTKLWEIKDIDGYSDTCVIIRTPAALEAFIEWYWEQDDKPDARRLLFMDSFKTEWPMYLNTKITSEYGLRMCRFMNSIEETSAYKLSSRVLFFDFISNTRADSEYVTAAWKHREMSRIYNKVYKEVTADIPWPVHREIINDCGHMSVKEDGLFAYTPDNDWGIADRQMSTKVGRYLKRLQADDRIDFVDNRLRDIGTIISAGAKPVVAEFARTQDEIAKVYGAGPGACMVPGHSEAGGIVPDFTPAVAYATDDLAVAYFKNAVGEIKARCVVNMKDKEFIKIYGDDVRLSKALEDAGYKWGSIEGCRIAKVDYRGRWVMPYLDDVGRVSDYSSDYWVAAEDGDLDAQQCSGLLEDTGGMYCPSCEEYCDEDDMTYIEGEDRHICSECINSHYHFVYGRYGDDFVHDDGIGSDNEIWVVDDKYCRRSWLEHEGYRYVESEDEWYSECSDDIVLDHFTDEWILTANATEFHARDSDGDVDERISMFTSDEDSIDDETINVPQYVRA